MDKPTNEGPGSIFVNNRMLRCGHTTGTCAAAATKAATEALLSKKPVESVKILTPKGILLDLPIEDLKISENKASCAVRKDGGDDIDATHGILVYSEVTLTDSSDIEIDGGEGVGRVTRKGLDQPVGNAAINRVPRNMIHDAVEDVFNTLGYSNGVLVKISVPEGLTVAKKTFNPHLGIEGGISILGTSGIVEPMSEAALVSTIKAEMNMRKASGQKTILVVPGNYGLKYTESIGGLDPETAVKCSNFIGETLDYACEIGLSGLLLVGNIGKLVKLAGGIMNTHSRHADSRMEILASHALMAGADAETARKIMECVTTDDALDILVEKDLVKKTISRLTDRIAFHMDHRTGGNIETGAMVFSSKYGFLGQTQNAEELIKKMDLEQ